MNGECTFTCPIGTHLIENGCEADSLEYCGKDRTNCMKENAMMACVDGICKLQSCAKGYHQYELECEKDDELNCGTHGVSCLNSTGNFMCETSLEIPKCIPVNCNNGYHLFGSVCEDNTIDNCGMHGKFCSITHGNAVCTSDGECIADSCQNGYELTADHKACILPSCQSDSDCKGNSSCLEYNVNDLIYKTCSKKDECNVNFTKINGKCIANPVSCGTNTCSKNQGCFNYTTWPYCDPCNEYTHKGESCVGFYDGVVSYGTCKQNEIVKNG